MAMHVCGRFHTSERYLGTGQPPGQATKIPLGADVGSRAQQHHEAQLVSDAEEAFHVGKARVVKLSRQRLMQIPRHIHLGGANTGTWITVGKENKVDRCASLSSSPYRGIGWDAALPKW